MSYYISVKDGDVVKEYRVPSFDEFTIAEWVRLCLPENTEQGQAQLMEEVKRMTGIPLKALRRLPMGEFDRMCDAYVALRTEAALRQNEVGGVDFANPSTIEHKGVTIMGPLNLAGEVPVNASSLYAKNLLAFLETMIDKKEGKLAVNWDDELVKATCLTKDGALVHPIFAPKS